MERSTIIYIACAITFLVLLALIMTSGKIFFNKLGLFFSDILKEKVDGGYKFSQGRVYLFMSLIFYFAILSLMSIKGVRPNTELKTETFDQVIEALQWIIALFAGYVFGAKGLKVIDAIFKYKTRKEEANGVSTDLNNIN